MEGGDVGAAAELHTGDGAAEGRASRRRQASSLQQLVLCMAHGEGCYMAGSTGLHW